MSTSTTPTTSVPRITRIGAKRVVQLIAVVLAVAAGVFMLFAPTYQIATSDSAGNSSTGTATILETSGAWAIVLALIPIAFALAPLGVPPRARQWVTNAAVVLFAGWIIVGIWTGGGFYVPAFLFLLASVFIRPRSSFGE